MILSNFEWDCDTLPVRMYIESGRLNYHCLVKWICQVDLPQMSNWHCLHAIVVDFHRSHVNMATVNSVINGGCTSAFYYI